MIFTCRFNNLNLSAKSKASTFRILKSEKEMQKTLRRNKNKFFKNTIKKYFNFSTLHTFICGQLSGPHFLPVYIPLKQPRAQRHPNTQPCIKSKKTIQLKGRYNFKCHEIKSQYNQMDPLSNPILATQNPNHADSYVTRWAPLAGPLMNCSHSADK